MKRLLFLPLAFLAPVPLASAQIYADFETSLGNFTCQLNYTAAPKTVANFVSLAEGTRKWADPTGLIRENTPFYNGLKFHRVIAAFMNQAGCPLGNGTSGPGYVFPDETVGGPLHEPYVISMANAGGYTNGSQFFVTVPRNALDDFSHLDGNHTVFGTVTSGRNIVDQINAVPVNASVPVTPVIIQSVTIRRIGTEAVAFDVHAWDLPEVSASAHDLKLDLPTLVQAVPRNPRDGRATVSTYVSEDLQTWELASRDYLGTGSSSGTDPFPIAVPYGSALYPEREFYRFTEALNPDAIVPASLGGKTLSVLWPGNSLVFTFNATGDGGSLIYNNETTPRNIIEIYESHSPYDLIIEAAGLLPLKISASLTSSTATHDSGTHKLTAYNGSWFLAGRGTMSITK